MLVNIELIIHIYPYYQPRSGMVRGWVVDLFLGYLAF